MSTWQFSEHFTWKVLCTAISRHTIDENIQLSKCGAGQTLNLGGCQHLKKGQRAVNAENFNFNLMTVPLINLILMDWRTILQEKELLNNVKQHR